MSDRLMLVRRYPYETYQVWFDLLDGGWIWEAHGVNDFVRDDELTGFATFEEAKKHAAKSLNAFESGDQGRWNLTAKAA